jgi:hypothetical protein
VGPDDDVGRRIPTGRAVTMADATGVTMGVVVATGIGHTGAWIVLTIVVVV